MFKKNKTRITLTISALFLCGASLACSVGLWVNEQQTITAMILAGIIATALELCKFALFPIANRYMAQSKLASISIYTLSSCLLIISIFATVAFLETGTTINQANNKSISKNHLLIESEIKSIDSQMEIISSLTKKDLEHGYRERAYSKSNQLNQLRDSKRNLIDKFIHLKAPVSNGAQSIFLSISKLVNKPEDSVRKLVYLIVAILVDVCGVVCLILLSTHRKLKTEPSIIYVNKTSDKITKEQCEALIKPIKKPSLRKPEHEEVKQNIIKGKYGDKPVVRNIIAKERIRHPELKAIFRDLISAGYLIRVGNRFKLTNKAKDLQ